MEWDDASVVDVVETGTLRLRLLINGFKFDLRLYVVAPWIQWSDWHSKDDVPGIQGQGVRG